MNKEKCTACSKIVQPYDGVFVQIEKEYQLLCVSCYNDMVAERFGIEFDNVSFDPISLKDSDGMSHTFLFRTRLLGDRVTIDAIERLDDGKQGYEFAVLGDADEDLFDLFKILFERIRRALQQKHIEPDDITRYRITQKDTVRGYITSDMNADTKNPLLVIDGKEIRWHEFGQMLSTFEGFNFKLEIFDKTEEK
jgi:hypothetical protein